MFGLFRIRAPLLICPDLYVSPRDRQDGARAPRCCADSAQRAAAVDRLHGDHGVAGQEGGEVCLPDGEIV